MPIDLNHNSIIPLYAQIVEQLQKDIDNGVFSETGRLPTESELSEQYNVSRITIRRAVNELVQKGLVEKKQGKGTFICTPKITRRLDSEAISFTELCAANGLSASAKILRAETCIPNAAFIRDMLNLNSGEPAVRICRLRYAGNRPLVLEDNYYPLEYTYLLSIDLENQHIGIYVRKKGLSYGQLLCVCVLYVRMSSYQNCSTFLAMPHSWKCADVWLGKMVSPYILAIKLDMVRILNLLFAEFV